MMRAFDILLKV